MNSSCREKLGELQICKSEIGRLAVVVEERFSRVKAENKEEQQLRNKAFRLEENLNKVRHFLYVTSVKLASELGEMTFSTGK